MDPLPFHRTGGCWLKPGDNQKNSFQRTSSGSYNEHVPGTRQVGLTVNKPQSGGSLTDGPFERLDVVTLGDATVTQRGHPGFRS